MNDAAPAIAETASSAPQIRNLAVRRCCAAYQRSLQESRAKRHDQYDTQEKSSQAFRNAMPILEDHESTMDFIACITRGMLMGVIDNNDGAKLLYAAQVSLGALRVERHKETISKQIARQITAMSLIELETPEPSNATTHPPSKTTHPPND